MSTESGEPWARVAAKYMAHKGYLPPPKPRDVIKIEGIPCWYFVYDLPDGSVLELEVAWEDEGLANVNGAGKWTTTVTTFQPAPS